MVRSSSNLWMLLLVSAVSASGLGCNIDSGPDGDDQQEIFIVSPDAEDLRKAPPIGTPAEANFLCAALNGGTLPPIVIEGPNGGSCTIVYTLSNCKQNPNGGCTCDSTVTSRTGDCG